MQNPSDSPPPVQTVELKIRPAQVALVGLTMLAVFAAALLALRLLDVLIMVFVALVIAATLRPMVAFLQRRKIVQPGLPRDRFALCAGAWSIGRAARVCADGWPISGAIPAILVALSISPQAALLVVGFTIVLQMAENHLLVQRLMGHSVGVSPIMVILAVFTFTTLLGITGAFLAIPLAAIIQVLMDHLVVNAGFANTEEPGQGTTNIMATMRAQIRRWRAEGLQRLRTGDARITLSKGDRDDVDSQVEDLLSKANQTLTDAAHTAATDTTELHTAQLAEVDLAINHAGKMVEEAAADTTAAHSAEAEATGVVI